MVPLDVPDATVTRAQAAIRPVLQRCRGVDQGTGWLKEREEAPVFEILGGSPRGGGI